MKQRAIHRLPCLAWTDGSGKKWLVFVASLRSLQLAAFLSSELVRFVTVRRECATGDGCPTQDQRLNHAKLSMYPRKTFRRISTGEKWFGNSNARPFHGLGSIGNHVIIAACVQLGVSGAGTRGTGNCCSYTEWSSS